MTLLKRQEEHQIPLVEFHARFHQHFGRILNVKDFGHASLQDLFGAIPHVQVTGEEAEAVVKLTRRAQADLFTLDLLEVLLKVY